MSVEEGNKRFYRYCEEEKGKEGKGYWVEFAEVGRFSLGEVVRFGNEYFRHAFR